MTHDQRLQLLQHLVLLVKVHLEELLVRAAGQIPRLYVHLPVVVDGDRQRVVDGAHEELEGVTRQRRLDERAGFRTDPVDFEPNQDLDLVCILLAQPLRFLKVCGFVGNQARLSVACFDLPLSLAVSINVDRLMKYLFGIEILFAPRHMLGQAEDLEFLCNSELDDLLQRVFGVSRAELPGVAVM